MEMHFSPHLARMIGLLPATSKDLHEVGRIRVSNMKGLVETNDTSAHPLVGLGPRITHQPVREAIEGNVLRVHTAPHRVNCDLSNNRHVHLPPVDHREDVCGEKYSQPLGHRAHLKKT